MARKKKKLKKDTRTVQCVFCKQNHIVSYGGWVTNALGQVLCHSKEKDCMNEHTEMLKYFSIDYRTLREYD